jgi:rhamnosyltransferase
MIPKSSVDKVAVLLASYNGGRFIADQLSTIRSQTGVSVSLYVRDDGSTDDTVYRIRAEAAHDEAVVLVDTGGDETGSAARNFLRMLSTVDLGDADYVALADQDDLWLSGKLQRAIECMRQSGAGGYSSNLHAFHNDGAKQPWPLLKHGPQKKFDHFFQGASAGCTYVLTRACAEALRDWLHGVDFPADLGISHDWLIYAFVRHRHLGWFCDDRALILYRQHGGNVYGANRGLPDLLARVGMLRNRWYRQHILWVASQLDLTSDEEALVKRIRRLSPIDRLWLCARANQLRRRPRDVLMLRLALLAHLF